MLRYVVLHHTDVSEPHFDVMVEIAAGALMTWRSARWPAHSGDRWKKIADHRREYLEFEGTVSGGRGIVRRVESGRCEWERAPGEELAVRFLRAGTGQVELKLKGVGGEWWVVL